MLVHRFLEEWARRTPDAIALVEAQRSISYGDLNDLKNRFANLYSSDGVRRGDRVLIALENSIEFVAAYLGAMTIGAAAVPMPPGARNDRLTRALIDCTPTVCVVDTATAPELYSGGDPSYKVYVMSTVGGRGPGSRHYGRDVRDAIDSMSTTQPTARGIDLDIAAIIYTSGSTGDPRGVILTHRNIVSNTRSIVRYLNLTAHDSVMCVLPFSYVYGLSLLHTHLAVGGTAVLENRFAFPNVVLNAMREHRVTGFAGVPSTFALLLHRSNLSEVDLPHLRYVTQAGGRMSPAQIEEWRAKGPKAPFYVMYGATEAAARLTYLEPSDLFRKLGSIGRPIPNVDVFVVKDNGQRADPGEIGELVARGSNISPGYWHNEGESHEKFGPCGYRTGDLGYMDHDGYLFLVGRRHDMIKVGAHRVGAKEIEDVLHDFPGIHEAAVIGMPHELLGESPFAFVAPREAATFNVEVLQAFCRSRLPSHKMPSRFFVLGELPKIGAVGKVDKVGLRALAASNVSVRR